MLGGPLLPQDLGAALQALDTRHPSAPHMSPPGPGCLLLLVHISCSASLFRSQRRPGCHFWCGCVVPQGLFSLDVTVRLGFTHKHGRQGRWVLRWVLSFRKALPGAGGGCGSCLWDKCWVAVGFTQPRQILGTEPASCRSVLGCNSVPPPLNTPACIWCSSGL